MTQPSEGFRDHLRQQSLRYWLLALFVLGFVAMTAAFVPLTDHTTPVDLALVALIGGITLWRGWLPEDDPRTDPLAEVGVGLTIGVGPLVRIPSAQPWLLAPLVAPGL